MKHCSCCSKISNAGIFTVAKYCKKLKNLEIGLSQFPKNLISMIEHNGIKVKRGLPETGRKYALKQNLGLFSGPSGSGVMNCSAALDMSDGMGSSSK